jgi:5-methylcytosine-specific restriction endonuclease McrA
MRTEAEKRGRRIRKKRARAKLRGATVFEPIDNLEVYSRFNYKCNHCGIDTPLELKGLCLPNSPEMDHIIPLCKGGQHTWDNVQLLCRECNQAKGDTAPPEYDYINPHKRLRSNNIIKKIEPTVYTIEQVIALNVDLNRRLSNQFKLQCYG